MPGEIRVYGDLMYEGPAPAGLDPQSWRDVRAQFLSEKHGLAQEDAIAFLEACLGALDAASEHEEIVLWLDHRLSDQLILIKLLDWFSRSRREDRCLSLICVGQYPGISNFVGLGRLTPEQLSSLLGTRLAVSDAQFRLGSLAWDAFTAPDPTAIDEVLKEDTSPLPFLAAALRRHLEQFPSVGNGLSRTEQQCLSVLYERSALPAIEVFFAVQQMENPLFMGDRSFFGVLHEIASVRQPLIEIENGGPSDSNIAGASIRITETGSRVLENQLDHFRPNGIDRWVGGVHLRGPVATWRWDGDQRRLVASGI